MTTITLALSSKGQFTLPKKAREALGVELGEKIQIRIQGKKVEIKKEPNISDYYGKFDGMWGEEDPAEQIRRWRNRGSAQE